MENGNIGKHGPKQILRDRGNSEKKHKANDWSKNKELAVASKFLFVKIGSKKRAPNVTHINNHNERDPNPNRQIFMDGLIGQG